MTGNKEAHLKFEVRCEPCAGKGKGSEMKLVTDVEGTDSAHYQCPNCKHEITIHAYLDN